MGAVRALVPPRFKQFPFAKSLEHPVQQPLLRATFG
jgi:hypothetical protein